MVQNIARLYNQSQCICKFYIPHIISVIRIFSKRGPCSSNICFLQIRNDYQSRQKILQHIIKIKYWKIWKLLWVGNDRQGKKHYLAYQQQKRKLGFLVIIVDTEIIFTLMGFFLALIKCLILVEEKGEKTHIIRIVCYLSSDIFCKEQVLPERLSLASFALKA